MASVRDAIGSQPLVATLRWLAPGSLDVAQSFTAQPGDVFIVSFPKTGTTWCQQLCHQLRSPIADEGFDEISLVVPWFEVAPSLRQDLNAPHPAPPRCFKTHQPLSRLGHLDAGGTSAGARFLCLLRDPVATLVSDFKQMSSKGAPAAAARNVNAYARQRVFLGEAAEAEGTQPTRFGGGICDYYLEFWKCRALPQVMLLPYESMISDLRSMLPRIAQFMGLPPLSEEHLARVAEMGSFGWMQAHDSLFDDHHISRMLASSEGFTNNVKVGHVAAADLVVEISDETRELLAKRWREVVMPVTGHASYAEMLAELQASMVPVTVAS
eukprot:NODE_12720_length_1207_cov_14.523148.p1 GENE.NODE_12720_length_1207_cov_14.523148~~NODE_12720_length_1207_cov_14.523148.p1  ORF type:complete len:359 (-),score=90.00 NODE_12720_length_1207_cov_14.523148:131-1105(-)